MATDTLRVESVSANPDTIADAFNSALADYLARNEEHDAASAAFDAAEDVVARHNANGTRASAEEWDRWTHASNACGTLAEPLHEAKDRLLCTPAPDLPAFLRKVEAFALHNGGSNDAADFILAEAQRLQQALRG